LVDEVQKEKDEQFRDIYRQ